MGQCATNGFPYAGLQGGLYCLCSSAYGKYDKKVGDEECSMECPGGSPEMKCGGTWKNAVYEISESYNFQPTFLDIWRVLFLISKQPFNVNI